MTQPDPVDRFGLHFSMSDHEDNEHGKEDTHTEEAEEGIHAPTHEEPTTEASDHENVHFSITCATEIQPC